MKTQTEGTTYREGFSLIELMAVIAIIAILSSLLITGINRAIWEARKMAAMANGRQIFQTLFAAHLDGGGFPRSDDDPPLVTSTEYWQTSATNLTIDASFSLFSAHGIDEYDGLDATRFTAHNNAWCIVADIGPSTRSATPVLFTRNLEINALSDELKLSDKPPFGRRGVVVVSLDGRARVLTEDELAESFNPTRAENKVLRP